ncbi:MAG: hypothetical protein ACKO63_06115 [Nodosilinea sp.]
MQGALLPPGAIATPEMKTLQILLSRNCGDRPALEAGADLLRP